MDDRRAGQGIEMVSGLRVEGAATDALLAAQLNGQRRVGSLLRREFFSLKSRRLSGEGASDISLQVAGVQLAAAVEVARCPHAESEIGLVRPVDLVVARTASGAGEIRDLVVL